MPQQTVKRRRRVCPECGSADVITVVWGMPELGYWITRDTSRTRFAGCCIDEHSYKYECDHCGHAWQPILN
jgi:hypothetical protein